MKIRSIQYNICNLQSINRISSKRFFYMAYSCIGPSMNLTFHDVLFVVFNSNFSLLCRNDFSFCSKSSIPSKSQFNSMKSDTLASPNYRFFFSFCCDHTFSPWLNIYSFDVFPLNYFGWFCFALLCCAFSTCLVALKIVSFLYYINTAYFERVKYVNMWRL